MNHELARSLRRLLGYCKFVILAATIAAAGGIAAGTADATGPSVINTFAGGGSGPGTGDGGLATGAILLQPKHVAFDTNGNAYIADFADCRVRRVDHATHWITTFAGVGYVGSPSSCGADAGDDGSATGAVLSNPSGVATDGSGNVYVSDQGSGSVRKISGGIITTVATGLSQPKGLAVDAAGNILIANWTGNTVEKVTGGVRSTFAGGGSGPGIGDGGLATDALLNQPEDVAIDSAGNVFISDTVHCLVRRVDHVTNIITSVVGSGSCAYGGDGGLATSAGLTPWGVTFDALDNLYVSDAGACRVRYVDHVTNLITTVVGDGSCSFGGDGGLATGANLKAPIGVEFDGTGKLYIGDFQNQRVRVVAPTTVSVGGIAQEPNVGTLSGPRSPLGRHRWSYVAAGIVAVGLLGVLERRFRNRRYGR